MPDAETLQFLGSTVFRVLRPAIMEARDAQVGPTFALDLDLEAAEVVRDVVGNLELVVPPLVPHLALGNRIDRLVSHECLLRSGAVRAARRP